MGRACKSHDIRKEKQKGKRKILCMHELKKIPNPVFLIKITGFKYSWDSTKMDEIIVFNEHVSFPSDTANFSCVILSKFQ